MTAPPAPGHNARRGAPVGAWARLDAVGVVVWAAFGPATSPAPKCSTSAKTHEIRAVPAQNSDQNGRNDDRHPPHVGRMDPLDNFNFGGPTTPRGTPPQFEKCSKLTGTIIRVVGRSRGVNVVVVQKIIRPVSAWHARNFTMNLVLRGPKRHS